MARRTNGKAHGLRLHILDAGQFQTIDDVRRFVEGGAFGRVGCSVREVLFPDDAARPHGACGNPLGDRARLAASYLIEDLEEIAKRPLGVRSGSEPSLLPRVRRSRARGAPTALLYERSPADVLRTRRAPPPVKYFTRRPPVKCFIPGTPPQTRQSPPVGR
jgi:hypothetical protein